MGLETVELVQEIEETFLISIPDEDAARLGVLGDLARYVSNRTAGIPTECTFDQALRKNIAILVENHGVLEGKANSQSHVVLDLGLD